MPNVISAKRRKEAHYAECHYAECRGATRFAFKKKIQFDRKQLQLANLLLKWYGINH